MLYRHGTPKIIMVKEKKRDIIFDGLFSRSISKKSVKEASVILSVLLFKVNILFS
jgi:hypothetical protein